MKDCLRAELRVRASMIQSSDNPEHYCDVLARCINAMPDKGAWSVCLVLEKVTDIDGVTWQARAIKQNGQPVDVVYSSKFGFSVV